MYIHILLILPGDNFHHVFHLLFTYFILLMVISGDRPNELPVLQLGGKGLDTRTGQGLTWATELVWEWAFYLRSAGLSTEKGPQMQGSYRTLPEGSGRSEQSHFEVGNL